ncbi:hypothetical protein M9H77_15322 [Catharanthus roseus]|uniref:Uncharacterized protein n=1 Tax=Catharanthus roseus TaxID=4058 RepID=A0ACC0AX66_CATRO|nr:hypothetical protein M9H77_15322 [Catharanthus roseus]
MRSDCLTSLALEIKFASSPKLRIEELPVNGHILGYEMDWLPAAFAKRYDCKYTLSVFGKEEKEVTSVGTESGFKF